MVNSYTSNNVLRFIYREMSAEEIVSIAEQIRCDFELQRMFAEVNQAKRELPKVQFEPTPKVLDNIMNYASLRA